MFSIFFFLFLFRVQYLSVLRWSFGFSIPATTANDLRLRRIFYPIFYPLHYFLNLILEKEPVFPFLMLSAKQGNYWDHFYNVFGMTRCLTGDWNRDLPDSMPVLYQYAIDESLSNHESANKLYYTNGHLNHNGNMYIIILNTTCMWVFYLRLTVFACGLVLFDSIR